ncbi:MAG TPA: ribonuclease H family protein [Anaerolineae bacterium]|nr:ribonuclease H family protein [Anaerolineae bacterium]
MAKYYVVWEGHQPGIYTDWSSCQQQINGYPNARYKSFKSYAAAEAALTQHWDQHWGQKKSPAPAELPPAVIRDSIAVDAACNGAPGVLEFQGVWTGTGQQIFHHGPYPVGFTNLGEFLAIVTALRYLATNNLHKPIYTDSVTAKAWVRKKEVNSSLYRNDATAELWSAVDDALDWLQNHSYTTPIKKWNTKEWGEIPADFGRK